MGTLKLQNALSSHNNTRVRRAVLELFRDSTGSQAVSSSKDLGISKAVIMSTVDVLSSSGRSGDLSIVEGIMQHMQDHWRLPVDQEVHDTILRNLVKHGKARSTLHWLSDMRKKPGHCLPTLDQWHLFLEKCWKEDEVRLARRAVFSMRRSGCPPSESTFKLLLTIMFDSKSGPPRPDALKDIIWKMRDEGIPFTEALYNMAVSKYRDSGALTSLARVEELYQEMLQRREEMTKVEAPTDAQYTRQEEILTDILSEPNGKDRALKLLAEYQKRGFIPSTSTLTALGRSLSSVAELRFWERRLDVKANIATWGALIQNMAPKNIYNAIEAYRTALHDGHPPSLHMLSPLISAFSRRTFGKPSRESIDTALKFHRDYVTARTNNDLGADKTLPNNTSELTTYNILFRMLSSSSMTSKYFPIAVSLLEEMHKRGVAVDGATTTSTLILLMRNSTNYANAFDVYKKALKDKDGRTRFGPRQFAAILDTFCKLPFQEGLTPVPLYFEIVEDMRNAGFYMTSDIYTIIISHLARYVVTVPPADRDTRYKVASVIRRLHDMITLDASLVPDVALWNSLMDAYQRAGCFRDAYQLWNTLFISRKFDQASISIIMDACAYAGAVRTATDIYTRLHESNYKLNRRNWINWLECLCRLDKLGDALKLVCLEMGKDDRSIPPDEGIVRLLLRFAIRENREGEVRTKIKSYLPDLWESLPADIRNF